MIRCRTARAHVDAALERALSLEQRFRLEAHVERCAACAEYERRSRGLQELLEGQGDPPPAASDPEAAVHAVLTALARPAPASEKAWRPPAVRRASVAARTVLVAGLAAIAAAAAVLLFVRLQARDAHPAAEAPGVAAPETEAPESTPADERWNPARVEVEVRAALLATFAGELAPEARAAAGAGFTERTREAARAGWPVRRFVEGLLDSPDLGVARAAAGCLGALGDAAAAPALERALARTDLAHAALDALGALGEPAVAALERALAAPELAPHAVLRLCRTGGPRAAAALERAARAAGPHAEPSRAALLDALTATGPAAVASLLRLAAECEPDRAAAHGVLARLAVVEDAGPELVAALERERVPLELACRALAIVRHPSAAPWLEERCASSRERPHALAALAELDGNAPLGSALRLALAGRVPREDALDLLVQLLDRDAGRAASFTASVCDGGATADVGAAREWLALLIESEHPGAARALARLAVEPVLADDDRQWAALAVGELGAPEDGELLLAGLARVRRAAPERRAFAAGVLSIHALLGPDAVERLLAPCTSASRSRVLAALRAPATGAPPQPAVNVHRVARALEGALGELAAMTSEEIL